MTSRAVDTEALLTPAEVAGLFRVDPKTVTRWANAGKLTSLRIHVDPSQVHTSGLKRCLDTEESVQVFPFVRQMTQDRHPDLRVARGIP